MLILGLHTLSLTISCTTLNGTHLKGCGNSSPKTFLKTLHLNCGVSEVLMTMNNFELKYFSDSLTKEIGKAICYRSINCKNNNRSIGAGSRARRTAGAGLGYRRCQALTHGSGEEISRKGKFSSITNNKHLIEPSTMVILL